MANRTATLVRNANLPGIGWRRGTLIQSKNGRIKPDAMLYKGVEYPAPQGTYQIRSYQGTKAVYVTVGNDFDAALVMLEGLNATRQKEAAEITLGIAPAPHEQSRLGFGVSHPFARKRRMDGARGFCGPHALFIAGVTRKLESGCSQGRNPQDTG
jgi:hypothetical protein